MAKKKEKKIPEKQLMYEQMLTQQLYGGQPSREEGIAKLQSEYDAWNARQDGIAKLQSDYDNWLNEQQKAQQPVEAPKVETVEAPKVAPVQKTVAKKTQPKPVPALKEEKKYLTHADVLPSLNKRSVDVTNYPEMAKLEQGGNTDLFNRPQVDAKELAKAGWEDAGDGTATVFSSTYTNAKGDKAANFTPIVADKNGKYVRALSEKELTEYAEAVLDGRRKDDLKLQIGKAHPSIDDAVNAAERVHELQADYYLKPKKSNAVKASNEANSIAKIAKQLGISEDEVRQRMTTPKQELNAYDEKKIDKDTTEKLQAASSEKKRKAAQKKYNPWEAFTGRFAKATTDIVNAPIAIAGKLTGKNWSLYNDAQKQEFKDLREQHSVASTAGDLAGMTFAAYATGGGSAGTMAKEGAANAGQVFNALKDEAILNGASKGVAATQALKGALPTLATNAASNMPTDFAVDIIPTLANDIAEGEKTDGEIIRDTLLNTGINYGFNTIGDAISLGKAMKNMGNPITADDAFRANALEGYDRLRAINEPNSVKLPGGKNGEQINAERASIVEQLRRYSNGELSQKDLIDLGVTPEYLKELGNITNPMVMNQGAISKIAYPAGYMGGKHNLGYEAISEIPNRLNDPAAVMKSLTQPNSGVVLTDMFDAEGRPVIAPIHMDKAKDSNIVNELASMYGKGNIENMLENSDIIFKNEEKVRDVLSGNGLQLSKQKATADPLLNYNVANDALNVNKNSVNFELPEETFDKIDSHFEELARPLNEVQDSGIMDSVTDEKALTEWANVNEAYSDYLNKSMFGESVEEVEAAKKTLDNARKRYARAMKDIDPEVSQTFNSGSFGYKIGRPLNERNVNAVSKQGQEAVDVINELENFGNTNGVAQSIDNVPRNLSVEEVNLKGGKKGYYVAENSGSVSRNVENGKVYKTPEEAQEALEGMAKGQPAPKSPEVVAEPVPRNVEEIEPPVEDMVESGQSKHIRGAGEMQMEGVSDEVVADFQDNPQMHSVLRNADTKAKAENIYNTSNNPEVEFRDMLRQHDPAALPLGHQLAKDYSAAGNHEAAAQIYREMGEQLTKAGQFSQAAVINMMKNDPLTALQYAQRQIDTLNQQGLKRFGSKWNDFKLTDDEIKLFDNITPGDEDAIKAAYDIIGERLGKEYPTSFMDKLLEGRKIAMLFNVRTNVRNFGANVPTLGMRWAADRVEALGQNVAHLINPNFKVTQAVTGSGIQGRKLATEAFNSPRVQTMLEGTSGKYEIPDLKNSLVKNKQMYKGNRLEKWIDNLTGGGIQKINEKLFGKKGVQSGLETIRNATYKMLDLGDSPFVKENFVERLGSYINAQKIKNLDDIPDEAIELAWDEAMKATYKDESWAVKMLSKIKGGMESVPVVGRPISQGAIPFLQAPGNIAARMVDYSPIRGSKGVADIISGARANDLQKVTRGIEEASKGLTGTGMVLLGMKLRESGILTGTYSKDKDQKVFEKQNGFKEFALHIGDKYFTYDWAQPFAQSLITGTLLEDAIEKSDENNSDLLAYIDEKAGTNFNGSMVSKVAGVAGEAAKASLNSWFNASPLQGLQELLSGNYTDKDDIASSIKQTLVDDFAGAFVPSAVNAVAKSVDPVQRNATDKTNSTATFVNQQIAKIPGLSKTLPAKYDTWGREMKYADNKAMATASRFIIPGDYSYDKSDKIDKEINRLYKASNNAAVFPQVAPTKVNGETLNNKEVSEYQKDMGERSHQFVEELISTDFYKGMTNKDMAETVSKLYGVSKALTERDKFGKELADSSEYKKPIEEYDNAGGGKEGAKAVIKYYQGKQIASEAGISANSKAYESIQNNIKQGDMDAAKKVAENEKQVKDAFVEYGVENNSTSRKIYEKYKKV